MAAEATIVLLHLDIGEARLDRMLTLGPAQAFVKGEDVSDVVPLSAVSVRVPQAGDIQAGEDGPGPCLGHALPAELFRPSKPAVRNGIAAPPVISGRPMVDQVRPKDPIVAEAGDILLRS